MYAFISYTNTAQTVGTEHAADMPRMSKMLFIKPPLYISEMFSVSTLKIKKWANCYSCLELSETIKTLWNNYYLNFVSPDYISVLIRQCFCIFWHLRTDLCKSFLYILWNSDFLLSPPGVAVGWCCSASARECRCMVSTDAISKNSSIMRPRHDCEKTHAGKQT